MSTTVTLKYDPMWRALEWAKKNCRSYITNVSVSNDDCSKIRYYFGSKHEALLFQIRWSEQ
jgi:hypothetical protein